MGLGGLLLPLLVLGVAGSRLQLVTDPSSRALLGSGALLKCRFDVGGPVDLSALRVRWYLFEERIAQYDQGRAESQVRASVSEQELKTGDASLLLSNVTVSDEGPYKCVVGYGTEQLQGETTLRVLAPYEPPQLTVLSRAGGRLALQCRSAGGYPKPEITWHDGNGTQLSQAEPVELQRSSLGAFEVRSSLLLTPRPGGSVCCTLIHRPLQQNMSICETLPAPEAQRQAPEQQLPGWVMAVVTLALVTLMCVVLIHWGLPLIPAEGFHIG
ncbi:CD276 antigen-like [Mauremys mutica]|uniref:CD276 antigen-like n=1 Tax=Mauremys mutica TaxID=74926 RepID=UPI001D16C2B2|nr:CD276 antigen-like [Mauremys mutica]